MTYSKSNSENTTGQQVPKIADGSIHKTRPANSGPKLFDAILVEASHFANFSRIPYASSIVSHTPVQPANTISVNSTHTSVSLSATPNAISSIATNPPNIMSTASTTTATTTNVFTTNITSTSLSNNPR